MYNFSAGFLKHGFVIILICFYSCSSYSQANKKVRGFSFSFYDQKIGSSDLEKEYLYRSIALSINQKQKLLGLPIVDLTAEIQTQIGATNISEQREGSLVLKGIEAAILLGINLEISLLPQYWWIYVGGSIGPQFISNAPLRQNSGFVFSDSVYAGSHINVSKRSQLDLKVGFRHQSNAGISQPNGGINSIFVSVGVLSFIKR